MKLDSFVLSQLYHPNDWTHAQVAEQIRLLTEQNADPAALLRHYMQVTEHVKPVFHHFFLESFSGIVFAVLWVS